MFMMEAVKARPGDCLLLTGVLANLHSWTAEQTRFTRIS